MTTRAKRTAKPTQIEALIGHDRARCRNDW